MKNRGVRIRDSASILCESVMRFFSNVPAANGEIRLPNVILSLRYMVRHSSVEFSAEQHLGADMFGRLNHCL